MNFNFPLFANHQQALNENRLKKSIATGHQLHLNKMVFAYKMEHLQDHHDRLLDEYEKLIQKFRTVNRVISWTTI